MWVDHVPPTAAGIAGGDRWVNFTISITLPDKSTTTLGPFISDNAGGHAATYVPTSTGNYSFVFNFPGQIITGNAGTGLPVHPNPNTTPSIGDVYSAATSTPVTISVGTQPASTIPENPLPTGYWQEPIEGFNHYWYAIGGDWLGTAAVFSGATGNYGYMDNYNAYSQPVLSAHIVWTKPEAFGGQIGGQQNPLVAQGNESSIYYTGGAYQPKWAPIVIGGILYYTNYPSSTSETPSGWVAISLRTGQILWTKNTTDVLSFGQVYNYKSINMYGAFDYLWATRAGGKLDCFDAFTGHYVGTIYNVNIGTKIVGSEGSILGYYVNATTVGSGTKAVRTSSLTLWNSTLALYPIINSNWYSGGQNFNVSCAQGIEWSVPLPQSYQGNAFYTAGVGPTSLGIKVIDQMDQVVVLSVAPGNLSSSNWEVVAGFSMGGTPDGVSGVAKQLWMTNNTIIPFTTYYSGSAGDGVFTETCKETLGVYGYDVHSGKPLWTAYYNGNPLGYYDEQTNVLDGTNLVIWTFGGWVYDFNMTTGKTIWSWNDGTAGENTPYGVNPLWCQYTDHGTIAGGVFYVVTGHNYGPPLFSGAKIYALNMTNGNLLWDFLSFSSTGSIPVVDGYMLSYNSYDMQIYAYGRGLTRTTVSTSSAINTGTQVLNSGTKALIQGTVTDQSPGQTCIGIPEAGTPAISDASMSAWMAYLFEQSPEPMNATGVPVTLTYLDPNNNTGTIGTTYSDINGQYSYSFTPPVPGTYSIIATFGGSHSYFSSTAETHMLVLPSAAATAAPTATPTSAADTYFVPAIAGLFVLIIIVLAVVVLLMFRKRP